MKLYGPLITVLVLALLLAVPNLLSGHDLSTVMESTAPAEITFESTAPYYQPEAAVVSPGVPVRWINSTAYPERGNAPLLTPAALQCPSFDVPSNGLAAPTSHF